MQWKFVASTAFIFVYFEYILLLQFMVSFTYNMRKITASVTYANNHTYIQWMIQNSPKWTENFKVGYIGGQHMNNNIIKRRMYQQVINLMRLHFISDMKLCHWVTGSQLLRHRTLGPSKLWLIPWNAIMNYPLTQHHEQKEQNPWTHCCENIKLAVLLMFGNAYSKTTVKTAIFVGFLCSFFKTHLNLKHSCQVQSKKEGNDPDRSLWNPLNVRLEKFK